MFRRLVWPTSRRLRLLSAAGTALLAVLCGSAIAIRWSAKPTPAPITSPVESDDPFGLNAGVQNGQSPSPSAAASGTPSPTTLTAHGIPLKATSKTTALLGLGGFDTEVTVRNPGDLAHDGWLVQLTMPDATAVENRSADVVKVSQKDTIVTITPLKPSLAPGASIAFTVRFPKLIALGQSAKDCKIDGASCTAA